MTVDLGPFAKGNQMFKRILVPVDGSAPARRGLRTAIDIAVTTGAALRLFYAVDVFRMTLGTQTPCGDLVGMVEEAGAAILTEARAEAEAAGVEVETRLLADRGLTIDESIVRECSDAACDLVAMGSHGRRGLPRFLLGSDAEKVARRSKVPALFVRGEKADAAAAVATPPAGAARSRRPPFQRTLVAIDTGDTSAPVVSAAVELARSTGGTLRIVHVLDTLVFADALETGAAYRHTVMPALRAEGEALLAAAREGVAALRVEAGTQLLEGGAERAAEVIVDYADDWDADLVVVGSHGRRGLRGLLLGSDAAQVLRRATMPVMIVRVGGESAASRRAD